MINRLYLLLLLALPLPGIGAASEPAQLKHSGTIAVVHGPWAAVIIDDRSYLVPPTISIEHEDGRAGSATELIVGQQIRFDFRVDDEGRASLTRVLILTDSPQSGSDSRGSPAHKGLLR